MGLFGGLLGRGGGSDLLERLAMARAFSEGDYGAAANMNYRRQALAQDREDRELRQKAEEEQALQAAEQRSMQQEAAAGLRGPNGQPLFNKLQLNAMRPEDLSAVARETYSPWAVGPEGGSRGMVDPTTGQTNFQQAPWQRQIGRSIIGGGPNGGAPQTVYQGVEPIAVQPGGAVYGMYGDGTFANGSGAPAPQAATPAPTDPSYWTPIEDEPANRGGASRPGSRTFPRFPF